MSDQPEALRLIDTFVSKRDLAWHVSATAELRRLHEENERLTKASEKLAEMHVDDLIKIDQLRNDHKRVSAWVDAIRKSYTKEHQASAERHAAYVNLEKICNRGET